MRKDFLRLWVKSGPQKMLCFGGACIAFLLLVSSAIWLLDFPDVDDIPYFKTMEDSIGTYTDFTDTPSEFDVIGEDVLEIKAGEGLKLFAMDVSLCEGDVFAVSFDAVNHSETDAGLYVDLYSPDFDDGYCEFLCILHPGNNRINDVLRYGRYLHPDTCELRIFTFESAELELQNLQIQRQAEVRQGNPLVCVAVGLAATLCVLSSVYLAAYMSVQRKKNYAYTKGMLSRLRGFFVRGGDLPLYVIAVAIVTVALIVIYHDANIEYPLVYANGDELGVYYFAKTIMNFGSGGLVNTMAGGISGADMFDYILSEKFSFYILKLLGCFTSNPYLAVNLLYFLNYYLIAISGLFAGRKLGLGRPSSVIVSCLYSFSPFIQLRYTHMWLTPYYMIPLACMIAIQIVDGGDRKASGETASLIDNRSFWINIVIAFFCAFTGLYYAFFACAIFAAAIVIRLMNVERRSPKIKQELYPLLFIFVVSCAVIVNIMPNLLYYAINGVNHYGELAIRSGDGAEVYALKLVQLLLPRPGHRLSIFNQLTGRYSSSYPLVNENMTASLGMVSALGFVLSLLFLFRKDAQYKTFSYLNIAAFLIATIGGVGSILSFVIKSMRCYNRMSLFIMFFSLLLIGRLLDRVKNKRVYATLCAGVLLLGLYDQTATYAQGNYSRFETNRDFIHQIQSVLAAGDMVFMLPYTAWPSYPAYEMHIGFLESETIRWSYGAMQGREEAIWQASVASKDVKTMLSLLRNAEYDGIYLDVGLYTSIYGEGQTEQLIEDLSVSLNQEPMISGDEAAIFWDIRQ